MAVVGRLKLLLRLRLASAAAAAVAWNRAKPHPDDDRLCGTRALVLLLRLCGEGACPPSLLHTLVLWRRKGVGVLPLFCWGPLL